MIENGAVKARLVCVTYRGLVVGATGSQRGKEKVYWKGFREPMKYETRGSSPLMHRGIIFQSSNSIQLAQLRFSQTGTYICLKAKPPICFTSNEI